MYVLYVHTYNTIQYVVDRPEENEGQRPDKRSLQQNRPGSLVCSANKTSSFVSGPPPPPLHQGIDRLNSLAAALHLHILSPLIFPCVIISCPSPPPSAFPNTLTRVGCSRGWVWIIEVHNYITSSPRLHLAVGIGDVTKRLIST